MSSSSRRVHRLGGLRLEDIDWHCRVYLMQGNPAEVVERGKLHQLLEAKVRLVAGEYLSAEYKYLRTGFALAHYGRRGVTHSIWHWADWEGTWEFFCQAWYCYGRAVDTMAALDRVEPILCQHEIEVVMSEGLEFKKIAGQCSSHEDLIRLYRAADPLLGRL